MRHGAVLFTLMLISVAYGAAPFQQDISLDEISRKGKASTVLVMVPEFGEGTAFCVHQDGWFITNNHVIAGQKPKAGPIKLVINSGLPNEKVITAKVVRTDEKHDLALLQTSEKIDIKPLALSPSELLNELNEIYAFGFPFGHSLSSDGKNHPTISVNSGKVTSLRRKDRVLELIQIDASVNPGNSGGPLLNRQGQVVGIVVAGIKGSGVHFAVPTEYAAELMKKPDIKFAMPNIGKTELTKEHEFTAQVISMQPNDEFAVMLHLKVGNLPEQHVPMKKEGANYRVKVIPMPAPTGPKQLAVTAVIGDDSISAKALDTAILRIGEKSYPLKEIKDLVNSTICKARLVNGTEVSGPLSTKERFALLMAGKELDLDLTKLKELKVTHEAGPESMSAKVTASQQNKELASVSYNVIFKSLIEMADEMGGGKGTGAEAREMGKEGSGKESSAKESSGPITAAPERVHASLHL
ncbi:MAG: serine protease [Gemmatales bacterium]